MALRRHIGTAMYNAINHNICYIIVIFLILMLSLFYLTYNGNWLQETINMIITIYFMLKDSDP